MGAFAFYWVLSWIFITAVQAEDCAHPGQLEQVSVSHVYDGDTVKLQDGRKVRFIGINTPEIAREEKPGQPLALEAKEFLQTTIAKSDKLGLIYGQDRKDRYGRVLAHLYTADGRNIEQMLLAQGLAAAIAVPPNTTMLDCYLLTESRARKAGRGLWSISHYQPVPVENLSTRHLGFGFITGRISRLGESKKSIWLNFNSGVSLRVVKKDLGNFANIDPRHWLNRQVIARGWLVQHKKQKVMQIRHPASVQLAE